MWARTQLKIGWSDLLSGGLSCLTARDREAQASRAEDYWGEGRSVIATYSVRSGFDLLLQALALEPGDEVLFSALNVKGMVRIAGQHGLVPVPLDLDTGHAIPSRDALERAISPRSRVLVVAHLFGAHLDLGGLFALARRHGLIVVEDCAQAFCGRAYAGHPDADISMFSFGPIKTATALGGGLLKVRDPVLRARMRDIQSGYPVQPARAQLKRVVQFAALKLMTSRPAMGAIYRFCRGRGRNYEDTISERVRNVAPLKTVRKLHFQPSAAMLALLNRRLNRFDPDELSQRAAKGRRLCDLLGDAVAMPAVANRYHDYWVFPVLMDQPKQVIAALRAQGFDAAGLPRSQAVPAPEDRPWLAPDRAAQMLSDLVILPCYADMPDSELVRLAEAVRAIAEKTGTARTKAYAGRAGVHGRAVEAA